MAKRSKRVRKFDEFIDKKKAYPLEEAVELIKKVPHAKFDETVSISFDLNVDPKQSDQLVRGSITLPHGTGRSVKVAVFCKGEDVKKAKDAGADFIGDEELIKKVAGGFLDFDAAISTPEMMKEISRLGKVLGPRGLMPNPKAGTVSTDPAKAVKEVKAGKMEYRVDKLGNINARVGKVSFDNKALCENASSLINAVFKARPASVRSPYIKGAYISSTMGPGVKLDISKVEKAV